MNFEEKTISSRRIYEGRIIKVRVDDVSLPDGNESKREIVEHSGAVAILVVDEEKNMWMVRQYRKAVEKVLLEIPAGTLEVNEDPLECGKRELNEETGLKAKEWTELVTYHCAPGFCNEKTWIYMASNLEPEGDLCPDQDEFLEVVKIPVAEAYQKIFSGEIIDGKSIIAIQYAFHQLMGA